MDYPEIAQQIKVWSQELGFNSARITRPALPSGAAAALQRWLDAGYHGEMHYMQRHGSLRVEPEQLVPGTLSIISVSMSYWPADAAPADTVLANGQQAYLSRYALGRDYHKVLRNRLQQLALKLETRAGPLGYRVFTDSAPVAEVALAAQAGLGWRGKHTLLLNRERGSLFFLGELFTTLPLPVDAPLAQAHCGRCTRCMDACPTGAIVAPYQVDARRCISYLTIEHPGAIPVPLRALIGNRIYGCDDCQLVCPWNRFAHSSSEPDFAVRHGLDQATLLALFDWSEAQFNQRMVGSAIYRIGYQRWRRNLAVALGNAPASEAIVALLEARLSEATPLVAEHMRWALAQQRRDGAT